MEAYNVPDQGLADMYLIQGTYSNPQFTGQLEQFEAMYSDGAPEFFVDQGLYYPASYGYICPGFESTGDWEEHHRAFGLDGQDIQYNGSGNESTPSAYVYYPLNYGYEQSAYNPYNPYIPGAMIGVDGSLLAPHQYYVLPSYENSVMPAAYVPMVQSTPDTIANGVAESFVNNAPLVNQTDSHVATHNLPLNFPKTSAVGNATTQRNSFGVGPEGSGANVAPGKQPKPNVPSGSFLSQASLEALRARGQQVTKNGLSGKASSGRTTPKPAFPPANGLSGLESRDHDQSSVHKVRPNLLNGIGADDTKVRPDPPSKQNLVPRTNNSKNQLVVKARTTRAGNPDALGNIIIFTDQYNNVNIPIDVNAKFFVIKSYSEDDVHKSIKYNMWSSTPNGNTKLNVAYEDAQRVSVGNQRPCPIYLFFSVNASGQYCGVAEMSGPVDFNKDMDFWQQDKWSGSFPVKWHFVKDLPNPNFRHIILENNENKPVTNSRDTQEIPFKKGLEMLQIFKNYTLKTSLLDDFMYYENRQQIMQEERARLLIKSYGNPYLVPLVDPPRKLQNFHDFPSIGDVNVMKPGASIQKGKSVSPDVDANSSVSIGKPSFNSDISNSSGQVLADGVQNMAGELKMSSLTINSPEPASQSCTVSTTTNSEVADVVTIGSMPVKVKGAESPVFLTVGTIPLNPRALQCD